MNNKSRFLHGQRIEPPAIDGNMSIVDLIDKTFNAYNAARFREACHLFAERMLADDVTVGMSLSGAMTPAGLGMAAIIPLIRAGFVDWIVSTGANLYHDTHFGIGLEMRRGLHNLDDRVLREEGVVRIYDIFFEYDVLLKTDSFFREIISTPEFQRAMSTAEFHYLAARRQLDWNERRGKGSRGEQAPIRRQCRCERNGGDCLRREEERSEERDFDHRRRLAQKFCASDRTTNSGSPGSRRERPRLLPADH